MQRKPASINNTERISRGMRVLFRSMRPRRDELIAPEVHHTSAGDEYHVFYPRGKALRTVILIYGMAIQGEYDGRLLKFARSCTEAGLKVVIPHLPGLMEFCVAAGDMSRLENILITLGPTEKGRIGLIGFSTGGSYALLLAANTALRDKIAPVVLFSPIYDARDVAERLHAPVDPEPQTSKDWDEFYWGQFVIAFRNRKLLGIPKGVEKTLHTYMIDFVEFNLETKKTFYDRHIAPLQLTGRTDLLNEGPVLDLLSARGKLLAVRSPVFILHDASDRVVPPDHSHKMYTELMLRGAGFQQEVLVTHWLSHVEMQKTGSITELFKIISFVSELFRNSPAG